VNSKAITMSTPDHILKDAGLFAYQKTHDFLKDQFDLHESNPDVLAVASINAIQAGFLMLCIASYAATKHKHPVAITLAMITDVLKKSGPNIEKALEAAEIFTNTYPTPQ